MYFGGPATKMMITGQQRIMIKQFIMLVASEKKAIIDDDIFFLFNVYHIYHIFFISQIVWLTQNVDVSLQLMQTFSEISQAWA